MKLERERKRVETERREGERDRKREGEGEIESKDFTMKKSIARECVKCTKMSIQHI